MKRTDYPKSARHLTDALPVTDSTLQPSLNHVACADASGGHRMAYWQWGDAAASHVVVCAHGLTRQGRDFDTPARALLQAAQGAAPGHGLRVVCVDVVGRGQSDWLKDPAAYGVPTYVGDMLALLAQLHAQAPIGALDWVGTSMGGLIGMGLFGTPGLPLPVPLRRLVLNDVGPVIEWVALERIASYVGKTGQFPTLEQAAAAMRAISAGFGPHTDDEWLALSRPMVKPHAQGGVTLHYDPGVAVPFQGMQREAVAQGEAALWAAYDAITAPTLLLRGATSDLLSPATAQAMAQRGPKARVVEFAGVGHAPTLVHSDQVQVVRDFLLAP